MLLAQVMRAEMPMEIRRCAAGGHAFRPRPQVPQQRYCSAAACQRERRRRWQREKRESDPDYCENQARAQRAWAQNHSEYWREYRRLHPEYCERNRNAARQRQRDRRRRAAVATEFAKMDASMAGSPVVGRKNLNAIVFSLGHIGQQGPASGKRTGGADASVARVGDCSLFQAAGVLGGGEHLPATAAAGAPAPAASASNSRRRPALLGAGVPLVR
jgi:hypothetical protein